MPSLRRQILLYIFSLADLGLLSFALYVSIFAAAALAPLSVLGEKRIQVHTIVGIAVLLLMWRAAFTLLGLYRSKRLDRPLPEMIDLLKAAVVATLLVAMVGVAFNIQTITTAVLSRFLVLTMCCLSVSRLGLRQGLKIIRRRGRNLRHVMIVGTNSRAVAFANSVATKPELGYRLIGFVDDAWIGPTPENNVAAELVSDILGFRSYLRNHVIDEVIIALPIKSFYDKADELRQICQEHGVTARFLTNLFEQSTASTEVTELSTGPVVSFYTIPIDGFGLGLKRFFDIVGSGLLLLLFSPIMIAVMILVKLESDGPAVFVQERIGLNKRRFRIYKFRSMVANAESLQGQLESSNEAQGPVFKIKKDPRITRIGKLIRKTSVDELPQLINVLKGDMSLVGPRPLPVRDYTGFSEDWQRRRFSIRPGITCLWQISGRSSISFDKWIDLDLEYIDQWSLWLDVKILAKTIPAVLKGSGAA
jgi:exopolysaccharide biosynthesis polyprenyl glycosylphosphotransferase